MKNIKKTIVYIAFCIDFLKIVWQFQKKSIPLQK